MDLSNIVDDLNHDSSGNADAHGHAALFLIESLILSLIDTSVICATEARNVVSVAIDATEKMAADISVRPASLQQSISLLTEIKHSLRHVA